MLQSQQPPALASSGAMGAQSKSAWRLLSSDPAHQCSWGGRLRLILSRTLGSTSVESYCSMRFRTWHSSFSCASFFLARLQQPCEELLRTFSCQESEKTNHLMVCFAALQNSSGPAAIARVLTWRSSLCWRFVIWRW